MPRTRQHKTRSGETQLPRGVRLKPPIKIEHLRAHSEHDPEGAEEFVALIRALREESSGSSKL